jgi:hypothetical protein
VSLFRVYKTKLLTKNNGNGYLLSFIYSRMKKILFILFLMPVLGYSQKHAFTLYGNASLFYKKSLTLTKSPPIGGAAICGTRFSNVGVGLGLEAFKIEDKYSAAYPIFIDVRYFFNQKANAEKNSLLPFVAFNAGKLIWNTSFSNNTGLDNTVFYYKGRSMLAFEVGVHVNQKFKKKGIYIATGFKYLASNYYAENTNSYRVSSGGVIVVDTPVVTKYPTQLIHDRYLYLKLGYQF